MELSLKDTSQLKITEGTTVSVTNGTIWIKNESFERSFRVSDASFTAGNFWVDAIGKSVMIELYCNGELSYVLNLGLKEFDELFPKASINWGSYFFQLHYSRF